MRSTTNALFIGALVVLCGCFGQAPPITDGTSGTAAEASAGDGGMTATSTAAPATGSDDGIAPTSDSTNAPPDGTTGDGTDDGVVDDTTGEPPVMCEPGTRFRPPMLVVSLNSSFHEDRVWLRDDEREAWISSNRDNTYNLWWAIRDRPGLPFEMPVPLIESPLELRWPTLTEDRRTLYIAGSVVGEMFYSIMVATRAEPEHMFGPLSVVTDIGASTNDRAPWISPDGNTLYFHAQPDPTTPAEIYRSVRLDDQLGPRELVTELNSPHVDGHPVLRADQLEIFFSSNREDNDYDIWTSSRASTEALFAFPPQPVAEVSSPDEEDWPAWLSPDGCRLYLSRRPAGLHFEIWMAARD